MITIIILSKKPNSSNKNIFSAKKALLNNLTSFVFAAQGIKLKVRRLVFRKEESRMKYKKC
jgi:hypothetical protein